MVAQRMYSWRNGILTKGKLKLAAGNGVEIYWLIGKIDESGECSACYIYLCGYARVSQLLIYTNYK